MGIGGEGVLIEYVKVQKALFEIGQDIESGGTSESAGLTMGSRYIDLGGRAYTRQGFSRELVDVRGGGAVIGIRARHLRCDGAREIYFC